MDTKKYGQSYEAPENRDQFVDVEKGTVIDKTDIPPLEVIRAIAKRYDINISDPSKGCKFCYGRGYIGRDLVTKAPIPCTCIFRDRTAKQKFQDMQAAQMYGKWNHAIRRKMKKAIHNRVSNNDQVAKTLAHERAIAPSTPAASPIDIFKPKVESNTSIIIEVPTLSG